MFVFVCVCGMHEDGAADGYTNIGLKSNLAKVVFALCLYSNITLSVWLRNMCSVRFMPVYKTYIGRVGCR